MKFKRVLFTKKYFLPVVVVASILPSTMKGEALFTKKAEVTFVKQDEKVVQLIPVVVTILEFMTIKVAADVLIDWLKVVYGDTWQSTVSALCAKEVAVVMDKRAITLGKQSISIDDFVRRYK